MVLPFVVFAGVPDPESPRTLIILLPTAAWRPSGSWLVWCRGVLTGQGGSAASADARTGRRFPSQGFKF